MHTLLYVLLAVIAVGGLFVLFAWLLPRGEQIAPPAIDTRRWPGLPAGAMTAREVTDIRLPVALRGYRFAETDLLLDRLADELRQRDEELARLRGSQPDEAYRPVEPFPIEDETYWQPPRGDRP